MAECTRCPRKSRSPRLARVRALEERMERLTVELAAIAAEPAALPACEDLEAETLRQNEERLRLMIRSAPVVIWTLNLDGVFTFSDGAGLRPLGRQPGELVGKSVFEMYPEDHPIMDQTRRALAGEEFTASGVFDGISLEWRYSPLRDSEGGITGILGIATDVTERDQAVAALSDSEARYRHIVANVPGMVYQFVLRPDGTMALPFVSDACREIYRLEPEEIRADASLIVDIIHPEDRPGFDRSVMASMANLSRWKWEGRVVLNWGEEKWLQGTSQPERQPGGDIQWDGVILDVTPRKRAEEALRRAHLDLEQRVRERTAELARTNASLEAEVAERRRAEEFARRQAEALAQAELLARGQARALTGTLDRLASEPSLDKFLGHVLRTINELFQAAGSTVWFRDPAGGVQSLHMAAANLGEAGECPCEVTAAPEIDIRPLLDALALTRRPVVLDARSGGALGEAGGPWRCFFARGVRTLLVAPLLMGDELVGSLAIESSREAPWRGEEIELAGALARQACLAVQLTRLGIERHRQAVLEERTRMAREIHDTLAQGFTGIIVQLQAARQALGGVGNDAAGDALKHMGSALDLARENLAEARRSVWALTPSALQGRDLAAAFGELIHRLPGDAAARVALACRGETRALDAEVETNLLRIGQEALGNALSHSDATRIAVTVVFHEDGVDLCVEDDGCGFEPGQASAAEGGRFGMSSMRERAARIGAELRLDSRPGVGTKVSVHAHSPAAR